LLKNGSVDVYCDAAINKLTLYLIEQVDYLIEDARQRFVPPDMDDAVMLQVL